ncbi:MAG: fatty acid desaturase [Alphaproteobacteria bacterium]|nr:fatty acid desaturase [Alphaproteobacteria bacterium]
MLLREFDEIRSLALLLLCYGLIFFLLFDPIGLPLWLRMISIIPLITLHSSLQHEFLHGHPFKNQHLNDLLAYPSMGIFVPYLRFKETHLKHHNNQIISDPYEDPESWYLAPEDWQRKSSLTKAMLTFNNTLFGRILIGPALSQIKFAFCELYHGNIKVKATWFCHFIVMAGYIWLIHKYTSMPIWAYFICCYFGLSLLGIRTFLEHQASDHILARTVIIEKQGILSFLFLNNNFHSVHHAYPALAWYRIPALFQRNRKRFLGQNHRYHFRSYGQIFRKYFFTPKEPVCYPVALKPDTQTTSSQ